MSKMFKILEKIRWTRSNPRNVAVQPSGCAPVVEAYNRGREAVAEWKSPRTIANGLKIPKPLAARWIVKRIRESKRIALKVRDTETGRALHQVATKEGMLREASSAAG